MNARQNIKLLPVGHFVFRTKISIRPICQLFGVQPSLLPFIITEVNLSIGLKRNVVFTSKLKF